MPLDFQTLSIPFGGGLAQQAAPALVPAGKLITASQAVLAKDGSIQQRPGTDELDARTTLTQAIMPDERETIAVTTKLVKTYVESAPEWRTVDECYEANISRVIRAERGNAAFRGNATHDSCVTSDGWLVSAWISGFSGATDKIYARFTCMDTGAKRDLIVGSDYEGGLSKGIRVLECDGYVWVIYHYVDGSGDGFVIGQRWTLANLDAGPTQVTLGVDAEPDYGQFDAVSRGDRLYIAYHAEYMLLDLLVERTRTTWITPAGVIVDTFDVAFMDPGPGPAIVNRGYGIDVDLTPVGFSNPMFYVGYDTYIGIGEDKSVHAFVVDAGTPDLVVGPSVVRAHGPGVTHERLSAVVQQGANRVWLAWELSASATDKAASLNGAWYKSTGEVDTQHQTYHVGLLSRPWIDATDATVYAVAYMRKLVEEVYGDVVTTVYQNNAWVVEMCAGTYSVDTGATNGQARAVCRVATHLLGPMTTMAQGVSIYDEQYWTAVAKIATTTQFAGSGDGFDVYGFRYSHPEDYVPTTVQGELCMSGGVPALYDGDRLSELGSHYYPFFDRLTTPTQAAAGSLTLLGTYLYVVVFEWHDARGRIHRSAPSVPKDVTLTGSNDQITLIFSTLQLTEREDGDDRNYPVKCVVYRTIANGSIYYREASYDNDMSDPWQTHVSGTVTDDDLIDNEILYTDGGVLANIQPPAVRHIINHGRRMWAISKDAPEQIWVSKIIQPGAEVPGFSAELVIQSEVGGAHVALASVGTQLIALKEEGIFVYAGDPPNDLLSGGNLAGPHPISLACGCISPKSVVSTPAGVVFQSRESFWQVDRGLQVTRVGAQVEDYLTSYPLCRGATLDQTREIVIFTMTTPTGLAGITLVWHYLTGEWTTWAVPLLSTATTSPPISSALCWRGDLERFEIHQAMAGAVVYLDDGWFDHDGESPTFVVSSAWLQFAGVAGFQRVRRLHLRGTWRRTHAVKIEIFYDFEVTAGTTVNLATTDIDAIRGSGTEEHIRVHVPRQKCKSLRVQITTTGPNLASYGGGTLPPNAGAHARWETIGVEVGTRKTMHKPAAVGSW